jgi:serralysin
MFLADVPIPILPIIIKKQPTESLAPLNISMRKHVLYPQMLFVLIILIALNSHAQHQQFTHTATRANISCNSDCTVLDVPELNNNPSAILLATPILEKRVNLNSHPIGIYYFENQWRIFNLDQKTMPAGASFNVEYAAKPDETHFQYLVTRENLQRDGSSFIDHPSMNNNPNVQFHFFPSWVPELQGAIANRDEVSIQFNPDAGKWYVSNINKKPLFTRIAYNIIIAGEANTVAGPVKGNPDISIEGSKKPVEILPDITKPLEKKDIPTGKTIAPSYDFSKVQICIEKVSKNNLPAKTPVTSQPVIPKINSTGGIEPVTTNMQPLSGVTDLMWSPGEMITVGFSSASPFIFTSKVKQYVKEWETHANITFSFITDVSLAKIKVGFEHDNTSWSWVGRDVLVNPSGEMTMNFGWFTTQTTETEFRRTILHEFGHALGFIHEHQAPLAGIAWDKEKVYSYYGAEPRNWDRAKVDFNIFARYSQTTTNSSAYDALSIMHYFFPADLTTDGSSFTWNTNLSATDKTFARQVYPFPPAPATATGILKTGDDCDEIEFTVEYNVVHNSEVEFLLRPGYDHHNALVTWWKMIGIPHKAGGVTALFLYSTKKMQANSIDKTKAITFGKAKILGVHTGLGFIWAPWPAIIGGCRVKFVWRRDSCN